MNKITLFVLLYLSTQLLFAASSKIILQGTSIPEIKLGFTERLEFPFLQGESSLTENNNIALEIGAEISPISLNGTVEAVLTPIAFLQFNLGGRIGSGWNIQVFDSKIYGIGLNRPNIDGIAEHYGSAFDGLLWKTQIGTALQADLAVLYPGEWNHVVARSYHEINYKGYTKAMAGESWYFEADDGENCNGFNYYGNLLIGYQMPIFIDFIALLAEADLSDRIRWTFSAISSFAVTEKLSFSVIPQFRTRLNYNEANWQDLYYRNRTINHSNSMHLEFYRIAVAMIYKFL